MDLLLSYRILISTGGCRSVPINKTKKVRMSAINAGVYDAQELQVYRRC